LIAHHLEIFCGLLVLAYSGVKIANGVENGEIFGVFLDDFLVLDNGIGELALLDKLLRRGKYLSFIETETECHNFERFKRRLPVIRGKTSLCASRA